jgi:Ca2+-transporting ATPase
MICFIGVVVGGLEALNVLQLLWVNLIMDTLGALALATEVPSPDLLLQKPHGKSQSLISIKMWKHILVQGSYQVAVMLFCLFALPKLNPRYHVTPKLEFYVNECPAITANFLGIPIGTGSYNNSVPDATWHCGVMEFCGYPMGKDTSNTILCPLYPLWTPLPGEHC